MKRPVSLSASVLAIGCALLALSGRAAADNELSLRVSTQFIGQNVGQSGLYATGASASVVQAEFGYARRLVPAWRGALWIEGSWIVGDRREPRLFSQFDSELLLQAFTAGLRYSLPVFSWLSPHLRVGGGALLGKYTLDGGTAGQASDWAAAVTGYALAGVEFLIPRHVKPGHSAATAGLVIEGGVSLSSRLAFSLSPNHGGDTLLIPESGVDLGALSLSGAVIRIGGVVRF